MTELDKPKRAEQYICKMAEEINSVTSETAAENMFSNENNQVLLLCDYRYLPSIQWVIIDNLDAIINFANSGEYKIQRLRNAE